MLRLDRSDLSAVVGRLHLSSDGSGAGNWLRLKLGVDAVDGGLCLGLVRCEFLLDLLENVL